MKARQYPSGAGGVSTVAYTWFRWGGGAHPGKTHVFLSWNIGLPSLDVSFQCVTDDFGRLVEVRS